LTGSLALVPHLEYLFLEDISTIAMAFGKTRETFTLPIVEGGARGRTQLVPFNLKNGSIEAVRSVRQSAPFGL
jgi:hypothetical protein